MILELCTVPKIPLVIPISHSKCSCGRFNVFADGLKTRLTGRIVRPQSRVCTDHTILWKILIFLCPIHPMLVVPVYQIWKIFSLKAPPTRVWEIYALGLKGWNIMPGFPTIYIKDCFEKIYFLAKGLFFLIFWMWHCFRPASHLASPRCWFIWKMHCFPTKLHKRSNYRGVRSLLKILMGLLQRSGPAHII